MSGHVWSISRRTALLRVTQLGLVLPVLLPRMLEADTCKTTFKWNSDGPFYLEDAKPDEPTGKEVRILGSVKDKLTCAPLAGARIIRWHTNKFGIYDEYFNTQLTTDANGAYAIDTIVPGQYNGVPRHVHFMVLLEGYVPLTTRWQIGDAESPRGDVPFDFVLQKA